MTVGELLEGEWIETTIAEREISGIEYDSRRVRKGGLFFAFPGARVDGHCFIPQALEAGAAAVASERPAPAERAGCWVRVRHGREALARAALRFYGRPDRRVALTGVTGTNGKSTTVYLIDSVLRAAGRKTARIGTIDHSIAGRAREAVNTTPESLDLVRYFVELEQAGGTGAVLEASSHALELRRIFGMRFHTAVFTNLSQDHLDFHGTMEAYRRAKFRLFEGAGAEPPRYAVINADDPAGRELLNMGGFEAVSYGQGPEARVRAVEVEADLGGLRVAIATPRGRLEVRSKLRGLFNVSNILAAAAAASCHEVDLEATRRGIEACAGVPGRFEPVDQGQPFLVVVDYAHTDDALDNVIEAARRLAGSASPQGRVLTVFGCGGDRDRGKRPKMGAAAGRGSDLVLVTSDNPRSEDPLAIIAEILPGLEAENAVYEVRPDRAEAIEEAIGRAREGDVVLIAGKGHETYQTVAGKNIPFDDRDVARRVLEQMGFRTPQTPPESGRAVD